MTRRKLVFLLWLALVAFLVTPALAEDAAALFKAKCAMCHGQAGAGDTAIAKKQNIRDLRSPEVQKQSDAELTAMIAEGGKAKKPGHQFAQKGLTGEQIKGLVGFIRELAKK